VSHASAPRSDREVAQALREVVVPVVSGATEWDALLDRIGDARVVLLGEASHGSHELYAARAAITQRLIAERGFNAVAIEGDWPDAYRVNRYVRGRSTDHDAVEALADFGRFPPWMWRNAEVLDFVGWLREHNDGGAAQVGFYGLDLYSLYASISAVLGYLERVDPEAAARARDRFACFDHFGDDGQRYGFAASLRLSKSCEQEAVQRLTELRRQAAELSTSAPLEEEERFFAEQNARVVNSAEAYYRALLDSQESAWNERDRHMAETLDGLLELLDGGRSKVVVWAHNAHLGDARATQMGERGELNLGQLARERHGAAALSVGFTTYTGTVTAAATWGGPAERKAVRPALPESYEALFHEVGLPGFLLDLRASHPAVEELRRRRLERAIGIVYLPESERPSHYFFATLPRQFDLVVHIDQTGAVEPLERTARWQHGEPPESMPTSA
jgi:erythromycin esterase-like protein